MKIFNKAHFYVKKKDVSIERKITIFIYGKLDEKMIRDYVFDLCYSLVFSLL